MIVLLGGGGFVGRATARALLHHGAHIHVLNRSGKAHHPDVPASRVDRSNPQEVILALDRLKAETVIDCIAFQSTDTLPLYQMIDQRGGNLTMLSSIDVYEAFGRVLGTENGPINQEPIRETSPLRSNLYPYAQIGGRQADYDKIPLEQAALSFRNARAQVVRLPMMFGPGDPRDRFAAVKQAIHEGRLWEYVIKKARAHPKLFEMIDVMTENSEFLGLGTPKLKVIHYGPRLR